MEFENKMSEIMEVRYAGSDQQGAYREGIQGVATSTIQQPDINSLHFPHHCLQKRQLCTTDPGVCKDFQYSKWPRLRICMLILNYDIS